MTIGLKVMACQRAIMVSRRVTRQQQRRTVLYDPHPCMAVSVNTPFVPLGLAEPAFQIQVVLRRIDQIRTREESRLKARHDAGQVLVERILLVLELRTQSGKLGLAFRRGSLAGVQQRLDAGYVAGLLANVLLNRLDRGQSAVDAAGQAAELLLFEAPFFSSKFRWIDSRTSFNASAIFRPGGWRGPP